MDSSYNIGDYYIGAVNGIPKSNVKENCMKRTSFIRRTTAAAVCSMGILSMSGCQIYETYKISKLMDESPSEYITHAYQISQENQSKGVFADELELACKALQKGSVTVDFDVEEVSVSSETAMDSESNVASQLFTLKNSAGDSAQVYFYTDKNLLKFGTNGASGQHIYDITYNSFVENLANSIFSPMTDTSFSVNEESYNSFVEALDQIGNVVNSGVSTNKTDGYKKIVTDYISSHEPEVQKKVDADINGTKATANIITYIISTDDSKNIINQFVDLLAQESFSDISDEDIKKELTDTINDIKKCDISIAYYINSQAHSLMKTNFSVDAIFDEETIKLNSDIFYGVEPKAAGGQKAIINMTVDGETQQLLNINANKNDDAYNLALEIPILDAGMFIEGKMSKSLTFLNVTIDKLKLTYDGEDLEYSPNAVVKVDQEGKPTVLESSGPFLSITEDEFNSVSADIYSDFAAILGISVPDTDFGGYDDDYAFNYGSTFDDYDNYPSYDDYDSYSDNDSSIETSDNSNWEYDYDDNNEDDSAESGNFNF